MSNTPIDNTVDKAIVKAEKISGKTFRLSYSDNSSEVRELTKTELAKTNLAIARGRKRAYKNTGDIRNQLNMQIAPTSSQQEIDETNEARHNASGIMPATNHSQIHGSASWQPANRLSAFVKDPNFVYRWVDKSPTDVNHALAEQWQFCEIHEVVAPIRGMNDPSGHFETANSVLMKLPLHLKLQRDAHYQSQIIDANGAAMEFRNTVGQDNNGKQVAYGKVDLERETTII